MKWMDPGKALASPKPFRDGRVTDMSTVNSSQSIVSFRQASKVDLFAVCKNVLYQGRNREIPANYRTGITISFSSV